MIANRCILMIGRQTTPTFRRKNAVFSVHVGVWVLVSESLDGFKKPLTNNMSCVEVCAQVTASMATGGQEVAKGNIVAQLARPAQKGRGRSATTESFFFLAGET